jgi:hypothetical protein
MRVRGSRKFAITTDDPSVNSSVNQTAAPEENLRAEAECMAASNSRERQETQTVVNKGSEMKSGPVNLQNGKSWRSKVWLPKYRSVSFSESFNDGRAGTVFGRLTPTEGALALK